jgi:hypothetical protein
LTRASAVEEGRCYDAPVQGMFRTTREAVTLSGVTIPAGARVFVVFGAANHDAHIFTTPERFDLQRPQVDKHLAFGHGTGSSAKRDTHEAPALPLARSPLESLVCPHGVCPGFNSPCSRYDRGRYAPRRAPLGEVARLIRGGGGWRARDALSPERACHTAP